MLSKYNNKLQTKPFNLITALTMTSMTIDTVNAESTQQEESNDAGLNTACTQTSDLKVVNEWKNEWNWKNITKYGLISVLTICVGTFVYAKYKKR